MKADEARRQTEVRKSMKIQHQYGHCKKEITKAVHDCKSEAKIDINLCEDVLHMLEVEGYCIERINYSTHFTISW